MKKLNFLLAVLTLITSSSSSFAFEKFSKLSDGLYRGSQPEDSVDYDYLKYLGIKTVINLRVTDKEINKEEIEVTQRGLTFYSYQINPIAPVNDKKVKEIFEIIRNPSAQPVFFHCRHGKDRTGMIAGLYRTFLDGWKKEDAYREMLVHGFNPMYLNLKKYFWETDSL